MNNSNKIERFIKLLDQKKSGQKQMFNFKKFSGPGLKRKLQRLIFSPKIYITYLLMKVSKKEKKAIVRLFWGKELKVNINDLDGFLLHSSGFLWEKEEYRLTKFFIKNLKRDDVFYDIGANYGFYSALALEFIDTGEVHTFEPNPHIFKYLETNFKNLPVFLNKKALGNQAKETDFFYTSRNSGGSTLIKEAVHKNLKYNKFKVEVIQMDNYLKTHSKPTIIKMDVEGAESLVIEGGEEFFKNNSPTIAMEVWPKNGGGEISMRAVNKLKELGYQSYIIEKDGGLKKNTGDLSKISLNHCSENFVFKK